MPIFCSKGVEDGQTVRMPVGSKEIFITFRVSCSVNLEMVYYLLLCKQSGMKGYYFQLLVKLSFLYNIIFVVFAG